MNVWKDIPVGDKPLMLLNMVIEVSAVRARETKIIVTATMDKYKRMAALYKKQLLKSLLDATFNFQMVRYNLVV